MTNKKKKNIKNISMLLLSLCTFISIYSNEVIPTVDDALCSIPINNVLTVSIAKLYLSLESVSIASCLVYVGIYLFYSKIIFSCKFDITSCITAFTFSLFLILGKSFHYFDSWDYIFENYFQLCMAIIQIVGWSVLFYCCLVIIFIYIERSLSSTLTTVKVRPYVSSAIIIFFWLPFIVAFLPSTFDWDSFVMLKFWNKDMPWTTHHPIIPTILLGLIMDWGLSLGSANLGAFFCLLLQTVLLLFAFIFILKCMSKLGGNRWILVFSLLFYALCPVWPAYAIHVIKDTVNLSFCIIYTICYIELLKDVTWIKKKLNVISFCLSIVGVCIFRNTGFYLVVLSMIPLCIYFFFQKKDTAMKILTCVLLCCCGVSFLNNCLASHFDIGAGSKGEMLSIPFQQTARYLREYPNEVTMEEKDAIGNLLVFDQLAHRYNPNISDPVKETIHSEDIEDFKNYFSAWTSMLLRHPSVYIEATMNGIYGYFYPDGISKARYTGLKFYIEGIYENSPNTGQYDVHYLIEKDNIRATIVKYSTDIWRVIPFLGLVYNTGIYTWILIFCIALMVKHKVYYALLGMLPSILTILFCIVSPVNGNVRYMLPVMAVTPLMIVWSLYAIRKSKKN